MKTSTIPVICSVALIATIAAGTSHWWSVRQFVVAFNEGLPVPAQPQIAPATKSRPTALAGHKSAPAGENRINPTVAQDSHQKDFYEALIAKMASVENQNRDLLDQLAETNRDLMKLEFRVDTHSESFRPLPVSEDQPFSSLEDEIGVLPPRAEPVSLPTHE